ncbi:hypothetical protein ACOME3_006116 [Neoechinorhynchus agilis]
MKSFDFIVPQVCILTGLGFVISGEMLRKAAIATAKQGFTHVIRNPNYDQPCSKSKPVAPLARSGIYLVCRHPSYLGWLIWQFGMQLMCCNPFCLILHSIISWRFFSDRIQYEEMTLFLLHGANYGQYKRQVPWSGIPFVKGVQFH